MYSPVYGPILRPFGQAGWLRESDRVLFYIAFTEGRWGGKNQTGIVTDSFRHFRGKSGNWRTPQARKEADASRTAIPSSGGIAGAPGPTGDARRTPAQGLGLRYVCRFRPRDQQ